jgi:signal transduction histidine kinase
MDQVPNILIVDDSEANLAYLEIILKDIKANFIKAASGHEALEKCKGKDLSLAILDVQMSVMDGYQLAIQINIERAEQKVPIIFLTAAYYDQSKILEGYDAGAVDYIIKPFHKNILISKINVFLELYWQKKRIIEKSEKLEASELEVIKAKEQLELLNHYLINLREKEKTEISMIVHDELGQSMTALKMDLNWVRENIGQKEASVEKLNKMIEMTNVIIRKVQHISSELHPGILEDLGLSSAIEWYCEEYEQRTGISCSLFLEEETSGSSIQNLTLFRILQEALTNVIRHAKATHVKVRLFSENNKIFLIIEDNGIGISREKIESGKSIGLIGMRTRAQQGGGTIEFSSLKEGGTRIITHIP